MFRAIMSWIDRDLASRKYSPVFSFGQRLLWSLPVFLSLAAISVMEALGAEPGGTATLVVFILGGIGMVAAMLVSIYRWMAGYSRTAFQEEAAADHRARVAATQAQLRQWLGKKVR